jgi:hypothetical protein
MSLLAFAQTVENIRVEPEGNNIKINYRIGGSTDAQLYDVFVTCSMDGGPRFEPESVIGDVGPNIRGGRSFYTVIWDVFEDVEEVGNAEFFIKVELVSDMAAPVMTPPAEETRRQVDQPQQKEKESRRKVEQPAKQDPSPFEPTFEKEDKKRTSRFERYLFLAYSGSIFNPFGFSAGTLKNWGAYGSVRLGYFNEIYESMEGSITAGITKHFFSSGKYRLHGYVGAGVGDFFDEFDVEGGITNIIGNRLKLTVGVEYPTYYANLVFGVGIIL